MADFAKDIKTEILRGVYPEPFTLFAPNSAKVFKIEILRFAQNDMVKGSE